MWLTVLVRLDTSSKCFAILSAFSLSVSLVACCLCLPLASLKAAYQYFDNSGRLNMLAIVVGMRCQPAQSFQAYFKRPPTSIVIPLFSPSISTLLFRPIRTCVNNGGYLPFDVGYLI